MTKKEIKEIFHKVNIQLSPGALEMIVDDVKRAEVKKITAMADRCKKGNVKRLSEDIFFIALGKLSG